MGIFIFMQKRTLEVLRGDGIRKASSITLDSNNREENKIIPEEKKNIGKS